MIANLSSSHWPRALRVATPFACLVGLHLACTTDVVAIGGSGGTDFGSTVAFTVGVTGVVGSVTSGGGQCSAMPTGDVVSLTSSGGGAGTECDFVSEDAALHQYVAHCTPEGCDCLIDGKSECTCVFPAPTACDVSCCGLPWLQKR